jgi:hypothetical protein
MYCMAKTLHELIATCLPTDNWRLTLIKEWPTIFGPLSARVSIEAVHDTTLVLGVSDACLMQELYLLSPLIVSTIQKTIGSSVIKQVRLKRTEMSMKHKPSKTMSVQHTKKTVLLTRAETHALECVRDLELREALKNYCMRCHQEREA